MLADIVPKLPMRNKSETQDFYINGLGFKELNDYGDYILLQRDQIEIHFFEFKALNPKENYGQVYIRTSNIDDFYQSLIQQNIPIHPNGPLQVKPWGQKEFSMLDPDNNLLTFGQTLHS